MHEYSIVSSLLDAVEAQAAAHRATAVSRLKLRIGEQSGVEIDLLRSAFEFASERTVCAGAELEVEPVPARWRCPRCGGGIERGAILRCEVCSVPARMESGDEIVLARIEMEVA